MMKVMVVGGGGREHAIIKKLRESKETIVADTEAYVEEHKDDERYVEYNRQFEEYERELKEAEQGKKLRKRKTHKLLEDGKSDKVDKK